MKLSIKRWKDVTKKSEGLGGVEIVESKNKANNFHNVKRIITSGNK